QTFSLEQEHVPPAQRGEVIRETGPDHAAADDHGPSVGGKRNAPGGRGRDGRLLERRMVDTYFCVSVCQADSGTGHAAATTGLADVEACDREVAAWMRGRPSPRVF